MGRAVIFRQTSSPAGQAGSGGGAAASRLIFKSPRRPLLLFLLPRKGNPKSDCVLSRHEAAPSPDLPSGSVSTSVGIVFQSDKPGRVTTRPYRAPGNQPVHG